MNFDRLVQFLSAGICLMVLMTTCRQTAYGDEAPVTTHRILLVTGEDYPGHEWRKTAPVLLAELLKDPRLTVDVLSDLKSLGATRLTDYDAVVMHFKNYDPKVPGKQGLDNLIQYVQQGGGLMLVHYACGAFEEFKSDFQQIAGRVWFGAQPPPGRAQHDPRGTFTVHIADPNHPITKGLKDFETVDELYTCLEGDTPIHPIATAQSKVDGKVYPMAFVLECGKGRVFHCVLGHDVEALSGAGPAELIRRGCAWIAGLEPTAVPSNRSPSSGFFEERCSCSHEDSHGVVFSRPSVLRPWHCQAFPMPGRKACRR
jgi:type 1 glutamine amidotransferase